MSNITAGTSIVTGMLCTAVVLPLQQYLLFFLTSCDLRQKKTNCFLEFLLNYVGEGGGKERDNAKRVQIQKLSHKLYFVMRIHHRTAKLRSSFSQLQIVLLSAVMSVKFSYHALHKQTK